MKKFFLMTLCLLLTGGVAFADWVEGDPYKMHYPQLPDPNGWDVMNPTGGSIADDWLCTQTGPVTDIHLWGSYKGDYITQDHTFSARLIIMDNIPAGTIHPFYGTTFSYNTPGTPLWSQTFTEGNDMTRREYGTGDQGWYNAWTGEYIESDHTDIWQYNFYVEDNPFVQEEGTVYWLYIDSYLTEYPAVQWGWKTSGSEHFGACATRQGVVYHEELLDPITGAWLDMAFVITSEPVPEPTTMFLLGSGLIGLAGFRRRFRKS